MEKNGIRTVVISIKKEIAEDIVTTGRTITTSTDGVKWYETGKNTDASLPED